MQLLIMIWYLEKNLTNLLGICINSLPPSVVFWYHLQNSLEPDQAPQNNLDPNCLTLWVSDGIPERIFPKGHMKNFPWKVLKALYVKNEHISPNRNYQVNSFFKEHYGPTIVDNLLCPNYSSVLTNTRLTVPESQTVWIQIKSNVTYLGPNCLQMLSADEKSCLS